MTSETPSMSGRSSTSRCVNASLLVDEIECVFELDQIESATLRYREQTSEGTPTPLVAMRS